MTSFFPFINPNNSNMAEVLIVVGIGIFTAVVIVGIVIEAPMIYHEIKEKWKEITRKRKEKRALKRIIHQLHSHTLTNLQIITEKPE